MLPIAGFDILDNDELIELDIVIDAVRLIEPIKINRDIVFLIENIPFRNFKGDIFSDDCPDFIIELTPNLFERMVNKALGLEIEPIKISKKYALKLLAIATGKEKPNQGIRDNGLKIPKVYRKKEQFLFVQACIEAYMNGCNEFPPNADSLLKYCCIHQVQGYSDLEDTGDKDKTRRINFTGDKRTFIRWQKFAEILGEFKEAQR